MKKITKKREFTISRKNYSGSRVCCDYKRSRVKLFVISFLLEKKEYISMVGDVVDANIMDCCTHKI